MGDIKRHTIDSFLTLMEERGCQRAINIPYLFSIFGSKETESSMAYHERSSWVPDRYDAPLTKWEAVRVVHEVWPEVFCQPKEPKQDEGCGCKCREAGEITFCGQCTETESEPEEDTDGDEEDEAEDDVHIVSMLSYIFEKYPSFYEKYSTKCKDVEDDQEVMDLIMGDLQEAKRLVDAFPRWEESWEQINRLAKVVRNDAHVEIYDGQRSVLPEKVVDQALNMLSEAKVSPEYFRAIDHIASYLKHHGLHTGQKVYDEAGSPIPRQVAIASARAFACAAELATSQQSEQQRPLNQDVEVFYMVWNPDGMLPKFRHYSAKSAEDEALRLATSNRKKSFFVLKSILMAVDNGPVVTRLGLEDQDIPF